MAKHIIIGAGPAGLTMAWELSIIDSDILVLEADNKYIGGIARTVEYKGNRFDMGGHRFYSKSMAINQLWNDILPDDFIEVPRLSRIYYKKKFLPYPLQFVATVQTLGVYGSVKAIVSYCCANIFPNNQDESLEDLVVNRFGRQLFITFFKSYTEKVWGISCNEISKDFVAQRIGGLSLFQAVKNIICPGETGKMATLIDSFIYPRLGPGQLWEAVRKHVVLNGVCLEKGKKVVEINHVSGTVISVKTADGVKYQGSHFYSTMCLCDIIKAMQPPAPEKVAQAAGDLKYRSFITVALIYDKGQLFDDNWIYIHEPEVRLGRIQNYKNWSKDMVPDTNQSCLGLEYFCQEGDDFWNKSDDELIALGKMEVEKIGLASASDCHDGCVVRIKKAYPLYDMKYKENRETIKNWLNSYFKNLYPVGRGGLHNYNSMDHSMMAGILAIRNMSKEIHFDLWTINTDNEYAERGDADNIIEKLIELRQTQR